MALSQLIAIQLMPTCDRPFPVLVILLLMVVRLVL
jgi:hypothetical protein